MDRADDDDEDDDDDDDEDEWEEDGEERDLAAMKLLVATGENAVAVARRPLMRSGRRDMVYLFPRVSVRDSGSGRVWASVVGRVVVASRWKVER